MNAILFLGVQTMTAMELYGTLQLQPHSPLISVNGPNLLKCNIFTKYFHLEQQIQKINK